MPGTSRSVRLHGICDRNVNEWTTWLLISSRSCSVSEPRRICRQLASSWVRNGFCSAVSSLKKVSPAIVAILSNPP